MKRQWLCRTCGICGKVIEAKRWGRINAKFIHHIEQEHTSEERQQYLMDNQKLKLSEAFRAEHSSQK